MRSAGKLALALLLACAALGCSPKGSERAAEFVFDEVAQASGLDFVHRNGMTGRMYMPEIVGPGTALFDYDDDGDLDVYLVQGVEPFVPGPDGLPAPPRDPELRGRLFRNDLRIGADGSRALRFTDVTAESGIEARGQGLGAAAADYDGDGFVDLYLTYYGPNQMWRNRGDGRFEDATGKTGTDDERWNTSASFFDYDRDGWLDLFVATYVDFSFASHKDCKGAGGRPDYCGPQSYNGQTSRLFHNRGDGTFRDVSGRSRILTAAGPALGVVAGDFDGDGWLDLYVANDLKPNYLWLNQRDGTFREDAVMAGASVDAEGRAQASMGVDAEDVDGDGDLDLFMTHLENETNTLYLNDGRAMFDDRSTASGIGPPSRGATGFGTAFLDYDNDGWLDVVAANGAVYLIEALARSGDSFPFHQPNQLFRNVGNGRFEDATEAGGPTLAISEVSRGLAVGDLDNDGDSDVVVCNNRGRTRLLLNQVGHTRPWLGVRVVLAGGRRDALGARVDLLRPDGRRLSRRVRTDGSYLSANDPRVSFGLGASEPAGTLRVIWPDGSVEEWPDLEPGRYWTLEQGSAPRRAGPSP